MHADEEVLDRCSYNGAEWAACKLQGARAELSPVVLGVREALEEALDPLGILDRGEALPTTSG